MIYKIKLKQTLYKEVTVEAVNEQDAIQQALDNSDSVIDTDDIVTEVVGVGYILE